jgi:hypothetical protein
MDLTHNAMTLTHFVMSLPQCDMIFDPLCHDFDPLCHDFDPLCHDFDPLCHETLIDSALFRKTSTAACTDFLFPNRFRLLFLKFFIVLVISVCLLSSSHSGLVFTGTSSREADPA